MKFVQAPLLASIFAASTLVGCASWGDVNVAYRMDSGLEPEHIDEHVRFRTTYYFRVVEGCPIEPLSLENQASDSSLFVKRIKGNFAPQSDSLYRFRMTGQSAALFNKIHFESGVLRKEQIDPFGSGVRFNQDTNSFIPVSADDLRAETKRASTLQDITRMRGLLQEFKDDTNLTETQRTAFNTKLQAIIETRIEALHATPPGAIPGTPISTKGSTSAPPNNPGVTIPATPLSQDKPEDTKKAKSKDSTPAAPNNPGPATLAAPLS